MNLQRQAFPPPPDFHKFYQAAEKKNKTASEDWRSECPDPPSPIDGEYQTFGEIHETKGGIPKIQVQQLFTDDNIDYKSELRKLNRETLFCFLELLNVLIEDPGGYARHLETLGVLLRNMHQLLNQMRPHQALATLEHMLKLDIDEGKQVLKDLKAKQKYANDILQNAAKAMNSPSLQDGQDLDMEAVSGEL